MKSASLILEVDHSPLKMNGVEEGEGEVSLSGNRTLCLIAETLLAYVNSLLIIRLKTDQGKEFLMSNNLLISLPDELLRYIDECVRDSNRPESPSEYIHDLIRRDMEERMLAQQVMEGLDDFKNGCFSSESILDILNEE